jgi:hypothetical protein
MHWRNGITLYEIDAEILVEQRWRLKRGIYGGSDFGLEVIERL